MGYKIITMRHDNAGNFKISIPESEVERMKLQGWKVDDESETESTEENEETE